MTRILFVAVVIVGWQTSWAVAQDDEDNAARFESLAQRYHSLIIRRPQKGKVEFIPHKIDDDSGVGTQFEVTDMNKDGKWDIVTSNKKGVHVFLQVP